MWDLFISHASIDKAEIVNPLVQKLKENGFKVWFDEEQIGIGDSISKQIENGLLNSKFVIVVLTKNFGNKKWASNELRTVFSLEDEKNNRILPLVYKINIDEIQKISPLLLDRAYVDISNDLDGACKKLMARVRTWPTIHSQNIVHKFSVDGDEVLSKVRLYYSGEAIIKHSDGDTGYKPSLTIPKEFFHSVVPISKLHEHLLSHVSKLKSYSFSLRQDEPLECPNCHGTAWSWFGTKVCNEYFTNVYIYFCLQCGHHYHIDREWN